MQVLFCKLTEKQRRTYKRYLASRDVSDILTGKRHSLEGITILRKICNHVDLIDRTSMQNDPDYGCPERSGKLTVTLKVRPLLNISKSNRIMCWIRGSNRLIVKLTVFCECANWILAYVLFACQDIPHFVWIFDPINLLVARTMTIAHFKGLQNSVWGTWNGSSNLLGVASEL